MSTFKCKMCGGTLEIQSGSTVAECEYCGAKQTLPKLDDEKRANLYDRANHFRRSNEFDKATAIYEQILNEDGTDAEAYWSLVLCHYGIEYVEDPLSHRRVPTVHRAQFTSIFDDDNYKLALENADSYQRIIYEEEAKAINEIQKGILAISQKEEPFDVFICYKETDANGKRTHDSVLANDLYYQLKQEGFKVFFARITLEDKLGSAYEPYIFAALNSAKVMVVLGTKPEYFNAVWVRNEWSRFLSLIKRGEQKMLIPAYRDMDPYDLPKEFSHLQAQDMSKLGFMQDLIRGIKKILGKDKKQVETVTERVVVNNEGHDISPILRRTFLFLEDGNFDSADEYAEKVLDINPECAEAYVAKLLIELEMRKPADLASAKTPISDSPNYQKAIRFATPEYRETIEGYNNAIIKRIDTARKDEVYARGVELMKLHRYDEAIHYFGKITSYKDSAQKIEDCKKLKETERLDGIYSRAMQAMNAGQFDEAASLFTSISDYKDAKEKVKLCGEKKETARKDAIYSAAMQRVLPKTADDALIKKSIEELHTISGYRDVDDQIRTLTIRLEKWYEDKKNAEEAARVRAEEERRTREREAELRRLKAEATKKKVKKVAKIGIPSVIALATLLVLLLTLVIPLIRYNQADKLFNEGKYDEAMEIYQDIGGFSESEQRIAVLNAIEKIDDTKFEDGIKEILAAGVPVKLTYGMGGGDFSGATHLSVPQNDANDGIMLLSASNTSDVMLLASTSDVLETTEYTYNSAADFAGIQTPGRNGYRFVKWELDTYNYQVEGTFEIKLNAVWSTKNYTVDYDLAKGKINGKNVVEYDPEDEAFTLINPTRTGYTFAGWIGTDLSEPQINVTVPTGSYGDRTYTATWTANEYTITYDAAGGTVSSATQTVAYDSNVEYLIPERAGYTFLGWYENNTKHKNEKWTRTSDLALVAKWEIIGYTISYEINDGTNHGENPTSYKVDTDTITLKDPSRTGYTFIGWTCEGQTTPTKNVTIEKGSVGNKTFTANWEAITTTITFNANSGVCSTTELSATYDKEFTLPEVTRSGYTFLGWFNNGTKYVSGTWKNYTNMELTAEWEIISYSITYELAGGTNAIGNPATYTVDQTVILEFPTRTGYTFLGWTYEGQTTPTKNVTIAKGSTGEKTYTANWEAISSTITLNPNGGACDPITIPVTYDGEFTLPIPEWAGHTFSGWYDGDTKITSGICKFYEDTTLVAEWDIIQYTVSYTMNGGTNAGSNPTSYNYHDTFTLADPEKTGYTFLGWTYEGQTIPTKSVTVVVGTTGDLAYTANWQENTYKVTFDANGGTVSPTSDDYTFDTNVTLPTPTRTGYRFDGWFVGTKQYTSGVWKTDDNVTLVAKWTANSYTITYDDVTEVDKTATITYNYNYRGSTSTTVTLYNGDSLTYPTAPTRSGYVFTGWYTDSSCETRYTFTGKITKDLTLYAGWVAHYSSAHSNTNINPTSYTSGSPYCISNSGTSSYYQKYLYLVANESGTHYIYYRNGYSSSSYKTYIGATNMTTGETIKTTSACSSTSYNYVTFTCEAGDVIVINLYMYSYSEYAYFYFSGFNSPTSSVTAELPTGGIEYEDNNVYTENYTFDTEYVLPEPKRVGYTFGGWFYNGNKVESGAWKIDESVTLTAVWTKNPYTVTFDANGGTCSETSKTVTYDSSYTLPTPTRTGYIFAGWFCGSTQYSGGTWLTPENTTLVAKWTARTDIEYVVNHYQQNANDDGYTIVDTEKLKGTADATIKASVKTYTHFVSPSTKTVTIAPDGGLVVDYYYNRVTYDLTYVTNGGETIKKQTYKYDQTLVISTPTRAGYTFGGWFTNKTLTTAYSATATLNAHTTIYAYWTEENKPGDFTYSGTSAITVSAYKGTSTTMWIPAYIGGVPVTTISDYAFRGDSDLLKVVVPESVESIGYGVFAGCTSLEDLTIPFIPYYTLENIFEGTSSQNQSNPHVPTSLRKVTITCQTEIPTAAFRYCKSIEEINIPKNVTSIGYYAFDGCSALLRLNSTIDGVVNIPEGVTEIMNATFRDCLLVESIDLGDTVNKIESSAFSGCAMLTEFTIPQTVTEIGNYAFSGCISLAKINSTIDGELIIPQSVTSIGNSAFTALANITKIYVPESVESIGYGVFAGCTNIEDLTIPFIPYYTLENIFEGTSSQNQSNPHVPTSLRKVTITCQTEIPTAAFRYCKSIEEINIPENVTSIGYYAFDGCSALLRLNSTIDGVVNIPEGVTEIKNDTFFKCLLLERINLGNAVTLIGPYAFSGCTMLTEFTIPQTVTEIGNYAFSGCISIIKINSEVEGELNLPVSVKAIDSYAFQGLAGITKVNVPDSVTTMGYGIFRDCTSIKEMTIPFIPNYTLNNLFYDYSEYTNNYYVPASLVKVTITNQTAIKNYSFKDCKYIEEISLPANVTSIGAYAFSGCSALVRLNSEVDGVFNIPEGVTEIQLDTFYNCLLAETINLGESVTSIGSSAFCGCKSLTAFTIPETVETIGYSAFNGCISIIKINSEVEGELNLPVSVKAIDSYAFQGLAGITKVNVPGSVTTMGYGIFRDCTSIKEMTIPFIPNYTLNNLFYDYSEYTNNYYVPASLVKVTITNQTAIKNYSFKDCKYIEEISLPANVTSIGAYAFSGCSALSRINSNVDGVFNIPESITEIKEYTFYNCLLAEVINLGEFVINIKDYAFAKCSSIKRFNSENESEFVLPESVRVISPHAFEGLISITKVVIPDSVSAINNDAFKGCNSIEEIILPFIGQKDAVSNAKYAVFGYIFGYDTGSIYNHPNENYDIPKSIKKVTVTAQTVIPEYAFRNCNFIETIILPSTVTSVGTNSFYGCTATVSYTYNATTSIWNGTDVSTSFTGSGTSSDPYQINSAADLAYLASSVNAGESYAGKYFVLNANINLNSLSWTPIGTKNKPFEGTFDGNGKKIYNLSVTMDTAYAGLFGYVSGTVKNLGVESGTLAPVSKSATTYVGPLVAYLTGTVENCYSQAAVSTSITNIVYAGGLVGHVDSAATVKDSYASGHISAVSSSGFAYAGGFAGANKGTIEGCLAFGDVTAKGSNEIYSRNGGFVAMNSGTLTECYRGETQTLVQYTTTGSAYCDDGTADSYSDMISYAKTNWSSSIWEYELKYPSHK